MCRRVKVFTGVSLSVACITFNVLSLYKAETHVVAHVHGNVKLMNLLYESKRHYIVIHILNEEYMMAR